LQSAFTYDTLNRVSGFSSRVTGYTYQLDCTAKTTSSTPRAAHVSPLS